MRFLQRGPLRTILGHDNVDGWVADLATWTYGSATTFTVVGDKTAKFSKGTRLKLTQTTVKYFVVVASSHSAGTTTVTITAGTDYTLANAAISANYYSYAANPQGYPGWFAHVPTFVGFSTPPGPDLCRFAVNGRVCTLQFEGSGVSNATNFTMTLPIASAIGRTNGMLGGRSYNNSAFSLDPGGITLVAASAVATMLKDLQGNGWTASGNKGTFLSIDYEI